MNIAIIPARGGSKRIPNKNIRLFAGKPIMAYSIDAARKSELFDLIIVSTDSPDIATVARDHGAAVHNRSPELSDDHTGTMPVIRDVLSKIEVHMACCIYPTAPLLDPRDLDIGYRTLLTRDYEQFAFSVCEYQMPIERALRLSGTGVVSAINPEHAGTRTQDLPKSYRDAAQFYWGRRRAILDRLPLYSDLSVGIPLPADRVCDIDTEDDWLMAERMFFARPGNL